MKKSKYFLIISVAFFLSAAIFFFYFNHLGKAKFAILYTKDSFIKMTIADTEDSWKLGLSKTKNLKSNEGMFFIFPRKSTKIFWMKDMLFPLDIIWLEKISENKYKILGVEKNVEPITPQEIKNKSYKFYNSPQNTDHVVEVNSGIYDLYHLNIGKEIEIIF